MRYSLYILLVLADVSSLDAHYHGSLNSLKLLHWIKGVGSRVIWRKNEKIKWLLLGRLGFLGLLVVWGLIEPRLLYLKEEIETRFLKFANRLLIRVQRCHVVASRFHFSELKS